MEKNYEENSENFNKNLLVSCLQKYKINILFGAGISASVYPTLSKESASNIVKKVYSFFYDFDNKKIKQDLDISDIEKEFLEKRVQDLIENKIKFEEILTSFNNFINTFSEFNINLNCSKKIEDDLIISLINSIKNNDKENSNSKEKAIASISSFLSSMYIITKRNNKNFYNFKNFIIDIFTTNYDLLIETSLEKNEYFYNDGFEGKIERILKPEIYNHYLTAEKNNNLSIDLNFNVVKLHGSINWEKTEDNIKFVDFNQEYKWKPFIVEPSKTKLTKVILNYNIYMLLQKFKNSLYIKDSFLMIFGTSLGDEHLNQIIFDSIKVTGNYVFYFPYNKDDKETADKIKEKKFKNSFSFIVLEPNDFTDEKDFSQFNLSKWNKIIIDCLLTKNDMDHYDKEILEDSKMLYTNQNDELKDENEIEENK